MFKNMKLGTKIGVGFAAAALVLVGAVLTSIWQVGKTSKVTGRAIELRSPSIQATLNLLNGTNHSLAALRGYMILGADKFKAERTVSWNDEIEPSLATLKKFAVNWTDPQNIERLQEIESRLSDFKKYQQEIENIAQAPENTPATKILFKEAAPLATILVSEITKMIDLEAGQAATPERKALLGMMADVRGTIGLALANIRAYLLSGDEKFKAKFDRLWAKNIKRFADLSANVNLLTVDQHKSFDAFTAARKEFAPLPAKMFAIRGGKEWNLANRWLGTKAAPQASVIIKDLIAMRKSQTALLAADVKEAKSLTANLNMVGWILLIAGCSLCTVLGIFITRSITKPIARIIEGLTAGADQVASASGQVSSSSQSLAQGASEQAASLEETSSSLEEMSSMTKRNADSAGQANSLAADARGSAEKGNEAMERMSTAINEIQRSSDETAKIIKVIDEIAFQTNLLALNAAVEAARAGEAGKGFAVVAEEVRNLAMRSAEAAKDTSAMIEESVKNSQNGVSLAGEVAGLLSDITDNSRKVSDLIGEISAAAGEQAQGIDQVNTAVTQMDKVTQQNAANAEESASASEELSSQAEQMNAVVNDLRNLVGGVSGHASNRSPSARHSVPSQTYAPASVTAVGTRGADQRIPFDENEIVIDNDADFSAFSG